MKVLLIQPPSVDPLTDQIFLFEPLALEYLGAGLQGENHQVYLLDARIEPDYEKVFRIFQPDVVCLTGFTSHVPVIKSIACQLKAIASDCLIIVGGHHATVQPHDFNDEHIDVVVIGEGVFTLLEILHSWKAGTELNGISGIAIPGKDSMLITVARSYTDLNELPFPNRDLTRKYRTHYFSEWFTPLASVRTSLGCTGRCNFCSLWKITAGKYLRRDPEKVVEELHTVAEKNVFFCDDESMCDVKRMDKLADLIAEAKIHKKYFLYGRVDTIVKNPELFAKWTKIGLSQVFVGMEDFSDKRLVAMNKGITTDQQKKAVQILDKLGIMMYASYMVDPAFTREDFAGLTAYVRKMKHKYASFTVLTPLPGTELYEARKDDLLSHKPELFDMLHALLPTTLPLQDFYGELAKLWTKAVPLYRALPPLFRFGLHGMFVRIKLFKQVLDKCKLMHLDY